MSEDLENFFYDPEDTDVELLTDKEQEMVKYHSMNNTYKLILHEYDFTVFPDTLFWLLTDYDKLTVFDVLIEYFQDSDREEYEKCAVLKKIKEERLTYIKQRGAKKGKFTYKLGVENKESILLNLLVTFHLIDFPSNHVKNQLYLRQTSWDCPVNDPLISYFLREKKI